MKRLLFIASMVLLLVGMAASAMAQDVARMTIEELSAQLDSGLVVVVDVRRGSDWKGSEVKIPGAVRLDPRDIRSGAASLPMDKELVLYCA